MTAASTDNLRAELRHLFGHDDFRPGQRAIVESAVEGTDTLAVMPTGGGKSLTYQLPAMLVPGATLVLSPLIALMKDQAENLPPAVAERSTIINSSLDASEVGRRLAMVKSGRIKLIYAAPERLRQPPFLHALRRADVSLVVVDEAHCISQWGHDFRPDYRAVGKAVASLDPRSVLAVTATATPEVQDDIERQLGREMRRLVRPTYRENLFLSSRKVAGEDDKLYAILDLCRENAGVGLVYANSREKCEQLARMLRRQGISAGFYHAGLPPDERAAAQDRFMQGEIRVMVATVAFGMGVDKADIRFLVHYHPARTLENYYQEAGRAGRDGLPSVCTLLHSAGDAANFTRHLREDTLTLEQVRSVYSAIRAALGRRIGPVAFEQLVQETGGEDGLVRSALPLLEEAGLIARHVDLPRALSLNPEFPGDEEEIPEDPEWDAVAPFVHGGDADPVSLSQDAGVPLPDLEETLLRFQDAGRLTFRTFGRDLLLEILPAPPDTKARMEAILRHRQESAKRRAEAMLSYARDNRCRHGAIARYFGDRWPNLPCGACDVCAGKPLTPSPSPAEGRGGEEAPVVDPARAPLLALQIVSDLAGGYRPFALGRAGLMRALRGTPDAPIKENRTAAFGALAGLKKAEVERLVDALVDQGFLRRDEDDEYRRLYLTPEGREAIAAGEADVEWRMSPPPKPAKTAVSKAAPAPEDDAEEVDEALFETLRTWRREQAERDSVPPYVVFADKVLRALAARKPTNEFEFLEIKGVGPAKAARFGEEVLEIIREHQGGTGG